MSSNPGSDQMQSRLIVIFLVLALCIGIAGYWYYEIQKQQTKKGIQDELSAIADLKVNQITAWRNERLEDAIEIVKNPLTKNAVARFLQNPRTEEPKGDILHWMKSLQEIDHFESVLLVDSLGRVRLSTSPDDKVIGPHAKQLVQEALRSGQSILSDFHMALVAPHPHLDLVAPLSIQQGNKNSPIAAFLIRINPETFLYPLIQSWPGSSRSAETLLIRKEGDSVLFLNELRHRKGTALSLRIPLDKKRLPASMAIQGTAGVFEGIDYRDVPVLASTRSIAQTPWFLVAKVDIEEVYAPVREQARLMSFVITLMIACAGLIILFWWRKNTAEEREKYYASELARKTLSQKYDYLSKYANDIILLCDPEGNIVEANDRAVAVYGYSRDELLRLSIRDLRAPETRHEITGQMQQVREYQGRIFETVHLRKDGVAFPVEVSSRIINDGGQDRFQSIIRDITERRQASQTLLDSERRFRDMLQGTELVAVMLDVNGHIVFCNDFLLTLTGWSREEALGQDWFESFLPGDIKDRIVAVFLRSVQSGDFPIHYENEIVTRSGERRMIAWSNTVLRSQAGNITGVTSIGEDITDKKNAEIALIKEKNWSQAIIAAIGDGISIQDRDFRVIYQNQVDKDLHGDHIGQFCYEAYEYQDKTCDGCAVAASFKDGMIHTTERTVQTGQGTLHVEITTSPLKDETGRIIAGIEAVRNITGRKQVENSLRDRNAFIEAITNNLPIGLAVNRVSDGNVIYMNSAFEEIYGWPKDLLSDVERFFTHVYPDPDFRKEIKEKILSDIAGGDPSRMQWDNVPIATQAGETKFVAAVNIPLFEQGLMISTVMDITARRQAEQALIESEQRYKRLVRSVTDYIVTIDVENGRAVATYHGPGCLNVTGYASNEYQADPDLWYRMIFDGDRNTVIEQTNAVLSGAPAAPFEHRIIHKDGSLRWVRHTPVPRAGGDGRVITVDSLITDITQLKLLESQLRQAQKMEAIGQLAGGIAHDFNNILTAIIGYSHLLLMKMDEGNPDRPYVEHIIASSERAAHLTQSLLAFSRKQIIDLKPVNLNDIIRRTDHLLERVIGEDIEFKTTLAEEGLPVMADSMHIEQVLMNLAANARDAMPNGGMLRLETGVASIGEDFIRTHSYGRPGTYAFLSITDTGSGMDENIRRRIFEPFFTTKEVGKGTGLGLSMVYGIVKQHHGYIDVYSEPGQGTTFKVYLPMLAAAAVEKPTPAPVGIARGTETVLLAEDDKTVRDLARHVLENSGYQVIEASDGEEAVAKFFDAGKHIDLLVFDIIMPKKNGKEAYLEIMKIRPDIKALFMSGYTADMVHNKGLLEINLDFVRKPISPTDLLKKVREILDRKS